MLARERRERLLAEMRNDGIEAVVAFGTSWQEAHMRYLADFAILEGSGIAILTADGQCRLLIDNATEAERASGETQGVEVRYVRDVARASSEQFEKFSNQRIVATPHALMPSWLTSPERKFRIEDGATLIDKMLMEKMPAEIATIRRAIKLADDGYAYFRDTAAKAGRKQYEVVADTEEFLRRQGSPDNFMIIGSGGVDVRGMAPPSERILEQGDFVLTELTPSADGYFAQICRTLVLGKATEMQKRAFNVYYEAMEAGIAVVKPGVTAGDIARAENDVFRKYGLGDYVTDKFTRVRGHGVGLMCDLKPSILEDIDIEMKPGMTIIVHPNTYHPEAGYIVLGDMLLVTETGSERLTRTPAKLFEMPV